jgi:hypothetical protein
MLKAVCQMFWTSRANHLFPNTTEPVPQAPSVAYLGIQWTTHLFQTLGFLPIDFDSLPLAPSATVPMSKTEIEAIYNTLDQATLDLLHQAIVCAFAGSHCAHHSPESMLINDPWLPADPINAIHATLLTLIQQRAKFRTTKQFLDKTVWLRDIFDFVGGAISTVYRVSISSAPLPFPPGMESPCIYFQFSRYSDRFLELSAFLQRQNSFSNPEWRKSNIPTQIQWYWNEKCAFIALWYGEKILVEAVSELFPAFPRAQITSYKHQSAFSKPSRLAIASNRPSISNMIIVGVISAGLALGATLVFRRGRRLFGWR